MHAFDDGEGEVAVSHASLRNNVSCRSNIHALPSGSSGAFERFPAEPWTEHGERKPGRLHRGDIGRAAYGGYGQRGTEAARQL